VVNYSMLQVSSIIASLKKYSIMFFLEILIYLQYQEFKKKFLMANTLRPLKNGNFCSSSRKAKISTTGIY